jgi:hypothetical protein
MIFKSKQLQKATKKFIVLNIACSSLPFARDFVRGFFEKRD